MSSPATRGSSTGRGPTAPSTRCAGRAIEPIADLLHFGLPGRPVGLRRPAAARSVPGLRARRSPTAIRGFAATRRSTSRDHRALLRARRAVERAAHGPTTPSWPPCRTLWRARSTGWRPSASAGRRRVFLQSDAARLVPPGRPRGIRSRWRASDDRTRAVRRLRPRLRTGAAAEGPGLAARERPDDGGCCGSWSTARPRAASSAWTTTRATSDSSRPTARARPASEAGFAAIARELPRPATACRSCSPRRTPRATSRPAGSPTTWNDTVALRDDGLPIRGLLLVQPDRPGRLGHLPGVAAGTVNSLGLVDLDRRRTPGRPRVRLRSRARRAPDGCGAMATARPRRAARDPREDA